QDRRAVMLYAGDFDATGLDIERDFRERTGCFEPFVRVALTAEQVDAYHLPLNPGKPTDSRAPTFTATYGQNVQVEFDALPPEVQGRPPRAGGGGVTDGGVGASSRPDSPVPPPPATERALTEEDPMTRPRDVEHVGSPLWDADRAPEAPPPEEADLCLRPLS